MLKVSGTQSSLGVRRLIRTVALRLAAEVSASYPRLQVTVDMESVDGEDAFVWIETPTGARPAGLEGFVDRIARRYARATGYWIVPRIVTAEPDSGLLFRLRPHLFELAESRRSPARPEFE